MAFLARFFQPPEASYFLLGPRGTGKSTWLKTYYPSALVIDLLNEDVYQSLASRPQRLQEIVVASPGQNPVVIDEIQRIPALLNVVHAVIESRAPRQFVLTGSSARKIRRGGVNLLGGRARLRTLHPFMASELPEFTLRERLQFGMLPSIWADSHPQEALAAYVGLYLKEEIQTEGWARRVGDFARFLESMSFSHGAVLNISNIARESNLKRTTVATYIDILEDLLLSFTIPVFTNRSKRKTSVHPKFYFFDTGVFRTVHTIPALERETAFVGQALEGLVAQHLRAWVAYSAGTHQLAFWRTASGSEVDFVIQGETGLWAIEVKNATHVRPEDLRSLKAFHSDYPTAVPMLLYRGQFRLQLGDIWCIPAEEYLRQLNPGISLSHWTE